MRWDGLRDLLAVDGAVDLWEETWLSLRKACQEGSLARRWTAYHLSVRFKSTWVSFNWATDIFLNKGLINGTPGIPYL